jgi:uncharacterized membrane protein AbrB (regulator of aidB expression)
MSKTIKLEILFWALMFMSSIILVLTFKPQGLEILAIIAGQLFAGMACVVSWHNYGK